MHSLRKGDGFLISTTRQTTLKAETMSLSVNGIDLLACASGALVWPDRHLVVVADLHFEKASSFARRGRLLPPYDTRETLIRLSSVIDHHRPQTVICLGDTFHDCEGWNRLAPEDRSTLSGLVGRCDWIWIQGNHDPLPPAGLGGSAAREIIEGKLCFRHAPQTGAAPGEVAGHLHPKAALRTRGRRISSACFVTDGQRLLLPAFGAFTGGLDVLDPAVSGLFQEGFQVVLRGAERLHLFPDHALVRIG